MRGGGQAAFLRRGLAPRARRSLQELPAFRSGGSASGTSRTTTGMSCEASALPPGPATPQGTSGEGSAFCTCTQPPAHPGMLQGQSGCGRAPSAAAVSPPEGKAARSPLPGPSAMSYRCFRLQPRRGVGRCCRRTQLSSRCSLRGEGASAPAAAPAPRHPLPPRHGPVPRAAFFLLLLLLAIPPARGRQLTPARSDLSCVKRG